MIVGWDTRSCTAIKYIIDRHETAWLDLKHSCKLVSLSCFLYSFLYVSFLFCSYLISNTSKAKLLVLYLLPNSTYHNQNANNKNPFTFNSIHLTSLLPAQLLSQNPGSSSCPLSTPSHWYISHRSKNESCLLLPRHVLVPGTLLNQQLTRFYCRRLIHGLQKETRSVALSWVWTSFLINFGA